MFGLGRKLRLESFEQSLAVFFNRFYYLKSTKMYIQKFESLSQTKKAKEEFQT